ncbi:MAG: FAD-dependent oxidoreductase [Pseudomonadota bacterium]
MSSGPSTGVSSLSRDRVEACLSVAVVDRGDVGGGTSSRSSRLIHGGLCYLEHYHFPLVAESTAYRWRLMKLAPHLVTPLPFLFPTYRGDKNPKAQDGEEAVEPGPAHPRHPAHNLPARSPPHRPHRQSHNSIRFPHEAQEAVHVPRGGPQIPGAREGRPSAESTSPASPASSRRIRSCVGTASSSQKSTTGPRSEARVVRRQSVTSPSSCCGWPKTTRAGATHEHSIVQATAEGQRLQRRAAAGSVPEFERVRRALRAFQQIRVPQPHCPSRREPPPSCDHGVH